MRINHNIAALNTFRQLSINNTTTGKSLEKLSSGLRINRAGDDAAGLAISEKMRGQIRGLDQATRNAQDGISMIQTAEGALNETHAILQRMRELAVQSASDTNTVSDRAEIQKEVDQLAVEITRIANNTEFNTQNLLNGGITAGGLGENTFHIGANANQSLTVNINAMDAKSLGVSRDTVAPTVVAGATSITGATISGTTGSSLVNGASITVSVADNTGVKASDTLTIGADTLTATAGAAGTELNGVKISFVADSDNTISATWDAGTNTLTVAADWDNSATKGPADIAAVQTAINTALQANGFAANAVTLDDDGGAVTVADLASAGVLELAGGADANAAETIVTFDDGTTTQTVTVADTATTVSVTSGAYQGLSFTTDNVTAANGTITVATAAASAATFAGGVKTADAVTAAGIDVSNRTSANNAITTIQNAIEMVSAERSKLGAYQNRLEHTINNLGAASENLTASESRIRDVDMAQEMMQFTKMSILSQAATAMLAQANQQPQTVLQLLG